MNFDLLIIGAGPGGYVAAERAADLGLKTAVVEKSLLGGTCLNRGCMPTKALLHASGEYARLRTAGSLGITTGETGFDFAEMHRYKNAAVEKLRAGIAQSFKARKITLIEGTAQIVSPNEVRVGGEAYTAKNIMVATGAAPGKPPVPGLDLPGVVTSDELLSSEGRAFARLAIIGGGVIGVEFASIYAALDSRVTILEAAPRILPMTDRDLSQSLTALLKKRGIAVHAGAKVERVEQAETGLTVVYTDKKGTASRVEADGVLVAVGRRADTENLFAPGLHPRTERGALVCDESFETSIQGIYAVGDAVAGNIQLAHAASAQGIAVVERLAGQPQSGGIGVIPSCIYTGPEIAMVGMTEEQAKAAGIPVLVGKVPTGANGKSVIEGSERGFVKLIFRAPDEVLLGAQLMCDRATDLIGFAALAITNGLTRAQLLRTVLPHPTFGELFTAAARAAHTR